MELLAQWASPAWHLPLIPSRPHISMLPWWLLCVLGATPQGRLVLHGWYTDPSPFFDGPLDEEDALDALNAVLIPMFDTLQALPPVLGTLSARLTVSGATGRVTDVAFLADTLVAPPAAAGGDLGGGLLDAATIRGAVQHTVVDSLKQAEFPTCEEGDTLITLPLVFE